MNLGDDPRFQDWVRHQRETTVKQMDDSAIIVHLSPKGDASQDVQYALELGLTILMGKPILVVIMPGREDYACGKLLEVADRVVHADVDTEEGQAQVQTAIKELLSEH